MKDKLQILFIPFLAVVIGFATIYNLVYWFLLHFFYPSIYNNSSVTLLFAFILAWIPVLIWIRPRINLLVLDKSRGQYFGFQIVCVFLITLVTYLTTEFTDMVAGQLTKLHNINEISKQPVTKFYAIENFYIAKQYKQTYYISSIVGRRSKSLRLNVYVVCPIYTKDVKPNKIILLPSNKLSSGKNKRYLSTDTTVAFIRDKYNSDILYPDTIQQKATIAPPLAKESGLEISKAWLGQKYEKSLKKVVYGERRKQVESDFYTDCLQQFENVNFDSLIYMENVEKNAIQDYYQAAIELGNNSDQATGVFVLEPRFKPFAKRWQNKLSSALITFVCCATVWLLVLLLVKFDQRRLQNFLARMHKQNFL